MIRRELVIYPTDRGDFLVFTVAFGRGARIAEWNPLRLASIEKLEPMLADLIDQRLRESCNKDDLSDEEAEMRAFMDSVKAKSWSSFYRDCERVTVRQDDVGYSITVGHWDGRGFDSDPEDLTELPLSISKEELAARVLEILKRVSAEIRRPGSPARRKR
jgi:hypothetical protein